MIGILGGTFDPVHYGHLRTALEVQQALGLSAVRLIPLRDPPHRDAPSATPGQRLAMLHAAVSDEPVLQVDDRELRRSGKSYTLDTLQSLRRELGRQPICLLLGSDAFRGFPDWHKPDEILRSAHLVIMQRPGESVPDIYRERLCNRAGELAGASSGRILLQQVTQLEISASAIRRMLQQGVSPRFLLPDSVLQYIHREALYR